MTQMETAPPRTSRLSRAGLWLGVVAVALAVLAILGNRTGVSGVGPAVLGMFGASIIGVLAVIVSLVAAIRTRPAAEKTGLPHAVTGLILGLVIVAFVLPQVVKAFSVPPIHDITTDTANPPEFVALADERKASPNGLEYGGEDVATAQKSAYPDITTVTMEDPPAEVFAEARKTAEAMGWKIVAADESARRIEATDTTFWMGYKDDVVIRIEPAGEGSKLDIRSMSRVGESDLGKNAERIRQFIWAVTHQAG